MHAFERRGDAQRRPAGDAEQGGAFQHQERPQPLAAIEHAVPHGGQQTGRTGDLAAARAAVEQAAELGFDVRRAPSEHLFEERRGNHGRQR